MSKRLRLTGYLLVLFCLQGCASTTPMEASPEPSVNQEKVIALSDFELYETLHLPYGKQIEILDASNGKLLLNVYEDFTPDSAYFREEGYMSFTSEIQVFDMNSKQIETKILYDDNNVGFCTSAALLEDSIVFSEILFMEDSLFCPYNIIEANENGPNIIASGMCDAAGFSDPRVVALTGQCFAYSYVNPETMEFGVNLVSKNRTVSHQILLVDDGSTEHLSSTLCGDGSKYIYYAAVKGRGTIFIADSDGILHQFELPKNERVYDYCFLKDSVLFTMEVITDNTSSREMVMKDFDGNQLAQLKSDAIFRLRSNNNDTVLSIGTDYQVYMTSIFENNLETQKLNVPAAPVLFYRLSPTKFLLHYNYSIRDSKVGVVLLDIGTAPMNASP